MPDRFRQLLQAGEYKKTLKRTFEHLQGRRILIAKFVAEIKGNHLCALASSFPVFKRAFNHQIHYETTFIFCFILMIFSLPIEKSQPNLKNNNFLYIIF